MHIQQFTFNTFQTRCSVVSDNEGNCAFVDPGFLSDAERGELFSYVASHGLKPVCIMLTHAHFDHIYGVSELSRRFSCPDHSAGLPVYMHSGETYTLENTNPSVCGCYGLPLPDISFAIASEGGDAVVKAVCEGDVIEVGGLRFEVIETPGHSRGGLCFFERSERVLFSGDTLFAGAIGRTDHPGGDYDALMNSIVTKLIPLDDTTASDPVSGAARHTSVTVIPGHGPCTDMATEGMTNPFLLPFNEPYED